MKFPQSSISAEGAFHTSLGQRPGKTARTKKMRGLKARLIEQAFSPHIVCWIRDLGRCPGLVWNAPLALCFGLATCLSACKPQAEPASPPPAPKISGDHITFDTNAPQLAYITVEPASEGYASTAGLYGRLAWDDSVTVRVFAPVEGRIKKIPVEVNGTVANGDPLAWLDSPDYSQSLADARAGAGNFAAADKAFTRSKELFSHGAAAEKDVEAAEAAFIAAQAERDRAITKLKNYFGGSPEDTNILYALRSPLGGVVVEKNVTTGQEIRPDLMLANEPRFTQPQFVVTDPAKLWLFLDVDETAAATLSPGQTVSIYSRAYPDKVFHGKIDIIGHELDPTTRTVNARCKVDNTDRLLRAEMYVTASVDADGTMIVSIPTKAVFLKNNKHFVFVETAPAQFERREVKLGAEGGGRSAIEEGLKSGQRVVVEGSLLLESLLEGADL